MKQSKTCETQSTPLPPGPTSRLADRAYSGVRAATLVRPPNAWRFSASYEERAQAYKSVKTSPVETTAAGELKSNNVAGPGLPNSYFVAKNLTTDTHLAPTYGNMRAIKYYPRAPPNTPREPTKPSTPLPGPEMFQPFISQVFSTSSTAHIPYAGEAGQKSVPTKLVGAGGDAQHRDTDTNSNTNAWSKIPSRIVQYSRFHAQQQLLDKVGLSGDGASVQVKPPGHYSNYIHRGACLGASQAHSHGHGYQRFASR